jgi:CubicO group peptidase (beta-lactamase class C family)
MVEDGFSPALSATLDAALGQVVTSFELPGLAVGIVAGEHRYTRGFGARRVGADEPVTPTSLFHLASISKPFVATAIMQLVSAGNIDLQAPATTYLPSFRLADDRQGAITVEQLLSHTSGMPDEEDYHWEDAEADDEALGRYVRSLASRALVFEPGTDFAYSNIAYEVLGAMVATVSGMSFEAYMEQRVLRPCGMATSTFLRRDVPVALATTPHMYLPVIAPAPFYPYHRAHAPSSTLHSSVDDMCNWARTILAQGRFDGTTVIDAATFANMVTPRRHIDDGPFEQDIGLGWFLGTYRGHATLSHGGADPGFDTNLVLLPQHNMGVVVLANAVPAPTGPITRMVLDMMLGDEPSPPLPPAFIPLGHTYAEQGLDAAIAHAQRIREEEAHRYDCDADWFEEQAAWLKDIRRDDFAGVIARLGAVFYPGEEHG